MEINPFVIAFVIAIFSIVQSLFGVGLLVFGTPTFLLLGFGYGEAVGYLLPSSLLLSILQSSNFKDRIKIGRGIILYAVPFVFFGMMLSVEFGQHSYVTVMVGIIMLLLALIRTINICKIFSTIKRFDRAFLVITGVVHGISNQGGALLTILMSSIYSDKEKVRTNIAFAYLLFGLSQLALLLWIKAEVFSWTSIVYSMVTVISYKLVGESLFRSVNIRMFNLIFTSFMFIYGLLLLVPTILN